LEILNLRQAAREQTRARHEQNREGDLGSHHDLPHPLRRTAHRPLARSLQSLAQIGPGSAKRRPKTEEQTGYDGDPKREQKHIEI
jgi:hypothetical protein